MVGMPEHHDLTTLLESVDGRGFGSYKRIAGSHDLGRYRLVVDHVQTDPFAPPSLMRVVIGRDAAGLPEDLVEDHAGRVATADFLTRTFATVADRVAPEPSGTGNGGLVSIGRPGQEVLERTHVLIAPDRVEARLAVGLPASGRRVRGRQASRLLTRVLPAIADEALRHEALDAAALREHVTLHRDQLHLRKQLREAGLIAFVGDGAILPRRSGDSDLPMTRGAVPFESPASMRVEFALPSGRTVTGMGVPEGVTVIVGGGYHGKSTLLRAIERGTYPHLAGDGREWVLTREDAVAVRAEDGRAVTDVDISAFITNLPSGTDTRRFTTGNASGSTSQAAGLVEALDAGSSALLIDEDTSATNFMIRDERMRELVPGDKEPITPFVERVRPLHTDRGVSTIVVTGGSGAFLEVADHVIAVDSYRPHDATERAHRVAGVAGPSGGTPPDAWPGGRVPAKGAVPPPRTRKPAKSRGRSEIRLGHETIDLAALEQLVDPEQTAAIARALDALADLFDGRRDLAAAVGELTRRLDEHGLDALAGRRSHPGHLTRPRPHEIHAAVNRYRALGSLPQER